MALAQWKLSQDFKADPGGTAQEWRHVTVQLGLLALLP